MFRSLASKIQRQRRWMSVRPALSESHHRPPSSDPLPRMKVTIQDLHNLRQSNTPITMITAYDYPSALACSSSPLTDITLVGDSLAQVCLGHSSTTQLTLSEMIHHAKAVARGTSHPFLVADMPFGSYHSSISQAIENAVDIIRQGRMEAVKLEGGTEIVDIVRRLSELGIPVMGHVGLRPQRHTLLSGYKVQGRTMDSGKKVLQDALALQEAGTFAIVIEAVPLELGGYITDRLKIPTIGIGAGPHTSGQVLVYDDIMGAWSGHKAKFVRHFANSREVREKAIQAYNETVRNGSFPDPEAESYSFNKSEWKRFLENEGGDDVQ